MVQRPAVTRRYEKNTSSLPFRTWLPFWKLQATLLNHNTANQNCSRTEVDETGAVGENHDKTTSHRGWRLSSVFRATQQQQQQPSLGKSEIGIWLIDSSSIRQHTFTHTRTHLCIHVGTLTRTQKYVHSHLYSKIISRTHTHKLCEKKSLEHFFLQAPSQLYSDQSCEGILAHL